MGLKKNKRRLFFFWFPPFVNKTIMDPKKKTKQRTRTTIREKKFNNPFRKNSYRLPLKD